VTSIPRILPLLFVLGLAGGPLRADADTVTLKDGRVLKGEIVEEQSSDVVLLMGGARRSFGRDFIAKIAYGDGADAGAEQAPGPPDGGGAVYQAGGPSSAIPAMPKADLLTALSVRYRVPVGDVAWVRRQGVPDADLSLVFLVAATARVVPRRVVELYLEGWSWDRIEDYFQMQPDDVYYEEDAGVDDPYYYPGLYGWDAWDGYDWGLGYAGGWGGNYGRGGGYHGGGRSWGGGRTPVGGGRGSWGGGPQGRGSYAAPASGGGQGGGFRGNGGGGFHGNVGGGGGSHGGGGASRGGGHN
jgi:hypothetical protein